MARMLAASGGPRPVQQNGVTRRRITPFTSNLLRTYFELSTSNFLLVLALFLVFLFFERKEARRRPESLAVVVQREVAHVKRHHATGPLLADDDGDRAPLDALAEANPAAAGKASVREPFQHEGIILQQRLDLPFELFLRCNAGMTLPDPPVAIHEH